jgi:hypothetical protein
MAAIPIIDDATRQTVADALDGFLLSAADGGLAKPCTLVYPAKTVSCTNCIFDTQNNRSSNRPRSGAPQPFNPGSTCPACAGKGLKLQPATELLHLKCTWDNKRFHKPFAYNDIRLANSLVELKCHISHLPKLLKAEYIIVNTEMEPYVRQKYRMVGEPGDPSNIVQGRYCVTYWERFNG